MNSRSGSNIISADAMEHDDTHSPCLLHFFDKPDDCRRIRMVLQSQRGHPQGIEMYEVRDHSGLISAYPRIFHRSGAPQRIHVIMSAGKRLRTGIGKGSDRFPVERIKEPVHEIDFIDHLCLCIRRRGHRIIRRWRTRMIQRMVSQLESRICNSTPSRHRDEVEIARQKKGRGQSCLFQLREGAVQLGDQGVIIRQHDRRLLMVRPLHRPNL